MVRKNAANDFFEKMENNSIHIYCCITMHKIAQIHFLVLILPLCKCYPFGYPKNMKISFELQLVLNTQFLLLPHDLNCILPFHHWQLLPPTQHHYLYVKNFFECNQLNVICHYHFHLKKQWRKPDCFPQYSF